MIGAVGEAIGQELALAVAVAVSPIPIIGVVVMLATPRARPNGPAFIVGWVVGLAVVGAIVLVASGGAGAGDGGAPAEWVDVLKLALGLVAILLAVRQWRRRPRPGGDPELPAWMERADELTAGRAAGLGALLSAVNPKNLLLTVAAAATIAETGASTGAQVGALAVFVAVATIGPGLPVALYLAGGERSRAIRDRLRSSMSAHNAAIMAVLLLVIGAKLIGDAISGFSG